MLPIFELEITNDIMYLLHKMNIGFYQRELSYDHCDVVNRLENIKIEESTRIASIPLCNGEYLVPLLKCLKNKNMEYYRNASSVLLHQIYIRHNIVSGNADGSVLEQLFAWVNGYLCLFEEQEKVHLSEEQLSAIFDLKLTEWLNVMDHKGNRKTFKSEA